MLAKLYDHWNNLVDWINGDVSENPTDLTRLEKNSLSANNASEARLATDEHDSQLLNILRNVYKAYGLQEEPRLIIFRNNSINAFYNFRADSVFISEKAVERLDKNEIEALLGHEVSHRVNRSQYLVAPFAVNLLSVAVTAVTVNAITNAVGGLFQTKAKQTTQSGLAKALGMSGAFIKSPFVFLASSLAVYPKIESVVSYPFMAWRRAQEHRADKQSVLHVKKPEGQINWLKKANEFYDEINRERGNIVPPPIAPTDPDKKHLTIEKKKTTPKEPSKWKKALRDARRTHPDPEDRFKRIRQTAQEHHISL